MATKENDTDPSTPSARRPAESPAPAPAGAGGEPIGPTLRSASGVPLRVSTDPGVGPAPQAKDAPLRPMGIVVPAAVPLGKKDSVEVLLEGMTTPQPPRTKTMPQTDGEASASYHARHDVRAARTSPDDEPKVIVERASLALEASTQPPTPLELAPTVPALGVERLDTAERAVRDKRRADARLPTAELPPRLGPRVALACAAGMLVVLFLFVALAALRASRPSEERASGAPAASAAPDEPPAAVVLTASAAGSSAPLPRGARSQAADLTVAAAPASSAASTASNQVAKAAPRARDTGKTAAATTPAASSAPDLSELKTSFH